MPEYIIKDGSIHERFMKARSKIQIAGGGFGNGKTASLCIKAITVAHDYPCSNILLGRSSYPKLNDTLRKEFFKWFPPDWKKSFDTKGNTLELRNGSTINFRYVQQRTHGEGTQATSNLLSATYDFIGIDQMDDPEFGYKDFVDLLGRLRGSARYTGRDETMPETGPRWFVITLNPTRNWIYKRVIRDVLNYKELGIMSARLQEMIHDYGSGSLDDFIQVHTGSTYENAHNLSDDYLRSLEALYQGTMKERFLLGGWHAYQGLVYPMFNEYIHLVPEYAINQWRHLHRPPRVLEMFDWGIAKPACYMLAFVDDKHNHVVVDGFYEAGLSPETMVFKIKEIRHNWGLPRDMTNPVYADPAIFRRVGGEFRTVGKSVASVIEDEGRGVFMQRGNNDKQSGIVKVSSYLTGHPSHVNPFTGKQGSPFLFFNRDRVQFVEEEITDYYYKHADNDDGAEDDPMDGMDHAMDALKYGLTGSPNVVAFIPKPKMDFSKFTKWQEYDAPVAKPNNPRYGYGTAH